MWLLTYLLTPWSRVLLEKLSGSAASQEITRIFGTRRFLTVFTSARHLSLSWANSIQSSQLPPNSWRSILILSSHLRLGLPNGLFPSGFLTRTLCTLLPSPIHATCPAHLILLDGSFCFQRKHLGLRIFLNMGFHGEAFLAPRPTPKLEDHPLPAARDCLFNIFAAILHIGGRSSIRNLRTCHAVVTGTHITWIMWLPFDEITFINTSAYVGHFNMFDTSDESTEHGTCEIIYIYIQGVPGGMCQTSGECSLS